MSVSTKIVPRPQIMRTFTRACKCSESVIWTQGDDAQAQRIESTRCSQCRESSAPKFGRGRGSSR